MNVLDFIATVYSYLGMDFALKLSTRPETALGDAAVWDKVCLIAPSAHGTCAHVLYSI